MEHPLLGQMDQKKRLSNPTTIIGDSQTAHGSTESVLVNDIEVSNSLLEEIPFSKSQVIDNSQLYRLRVDPDCQQNVICDKCEIVIRRKSASDHYNTGVCTEKYHIHNKSNGYLYFQSKGKIQSYAVTFEQITPTRLDPYLCFLLKFV